MNYKQFTLKGNILVLLLIALGCFTACDDYEANEPILTVQTFMQQAAISNIFQISTGNMAAHKGSITAIKTFGQMLGTEHTGFSNDLKALADQKVVALPQIMPQEKTQLVIDLLNKNGTAFDKLFSQTQIDAHQEAIKLYEKADKHFNDAQLQAFIDNTLPVLRLHLVEAKRLEAMAD